METCRTIDDQSQKNIVVEKTSNIPKFSVVSMVSTDLSNSLPLDMTFYKKDEKNYAILEKHDVMNRFHLDSHLRITMGGLVNKITLLDFPIGQYTLSLNGQNCATARYNKETNYYEFDLTRENSMLSILKKCAISGNEPKLDNRSDYINLYRIDNVSIIIPRSVQLNDRQTICLHGFFDHVEKWVETSHKLTLYPHNTYNLCISQPTESIDIKADRVDGTIILRVAGIELCTFKSNTNLMRIKFSNPDQLFNGKQNEYLSEEINRNVINMSRIDNVSIVAHDCKITEIYQNCYGIYSYPERSQIFIS